MINIQRGVKGREQLCASWGTRSLQQIDWQPAASLIISTWFTTLYKLCVFLVFVFLLQLQQMKLSRKQEHTRTKLALLPPFKILLTYQFTILLTKTKLPLNTRVFTAANCRLLLLNCGLNFCVWKAEKNRERHWTPSVVVILSLFSLFFLALIKNDASEGKRPESTMTTRDTWRQVAHLKFTVRNCQYAVVSVISFVYPKKKKKKFEERKFNWF